MSRSNVVVYFACFFVISIVLSTDILFKTWDEIFRRLMLVAVWGVFGHLARKASDAWKNIDT